MCSATQLQSAILLCISKIVQDKHFRKAESKKAILHDN